MSSHFALRRLPCLLLSGLLVLATAPAHAEKADRDKPVNIESDRMEYDDTRQLSTFIGRVVLVQGTLVIRADRLVLRQDAEGYQYGIATGKPATFRQKRDNVDQFIEGEGLTIDYDGKADVLTLRQQAVMRRFEDDKLMDEVHGALIIYRGETEFYTVDGAERGGSGRVRLTLQPRSKNPPAEPSAESSAQSPGARPASSQAPASKSTAPQSSGSQPATPLKPADSLKAPASAR